MKDAAYFLSDAHFKFNADEPRERMKRDRFISFLETIRGASRLYILGDLFDFWFEFRGAPPPFYGDILDALRSLRESGTTIYIAGGNHDWWLGEYVTGSLGLAVMPPVTTHEIQGRRVTMTHGDTLLPGDFAYKALKTVIRGRAAIAVARSLPPRILYGFARRFSKASKGVTEKRTERSARALVAMAPESFFKWGNDVFVMGHIHRPLLERFGARTFAIIGDWERHFSYCSLEGGALSLRLYGAAEATTIENR